MDKSTENNNETLTQNEEEKNIKKSTTKPKNKNVQKNQQTNQTGKNQKQKKQGEETVNGEEEKMTPTKQKGSKQNKERYRESQSVVNDEEQSEHIDKENSKQNQQKERSINKKQQKGKHPVEDEDQDVEMERETPEGEHRLKYGYTFWFNRRTQGARSQNPESYEKNIKKVGTFNTVEQFWSYYNHLVRPNELPVTSDYHLFKHGIKPMWEDKANIHGGKWIVRLPKGMASKSWEDLILAILGEQFDVGEEICGCVISIRYQSDIISIWNRNANDYDSKNKIKYLNQIVELIFNELKTDYFHL